MKHGLAHGKPPSRIVFPIKEISSSEKDLVCIRFCLISDWKQVLAVFHSCAAINIATLQVATRHSCYRKCLLLSSTFLDVVVENGRLKYINVCIHIQDFTVAHSTSMVPQV